MSRAVKAGEDYPGNSERELVELIRRAMLSASPPPTDAEISDLAEMANRLCGFDVTHEQMRQFLAALSKE